MPRREYRFSPRCAEGGCKEYVHYIYDTRAEEAAGRARQQKSPYRCTRHAKPEKVLRPDNLMRQQVLVAAKQPNTSYEWQKTLRQRQHEVGLGLDREPPDEFLPGLFWIAEDGDGLRSGFTYGPGFNAHADDFPEGTRLVVTARIELPEVADE